MSTSIGSTEGLRLIKVTDAALSDHVNGERDDIGLVCPDSLHREAGVRTELSRRCGWTCVRENGERSREGFGRTVELRILGQGGMRTALAQNWNQ